MKKILFVFAYLLLLAKPAQSQVVQQTAERDTTGYLILTHSEFMQAAERLAEWKKTLGFQTDILYVGSNDSSDTIEYLLNGYYSEHPHTKYLTILGGAGYVKPKTHSIYLNLSDYDSNYYNRDYSHPSDFFYGNLTADSVATVHRGRLIADNLAEANIIVDKIIRYESTPVVSDYYDKGIHVSYYDPMLINGTNYEKYRFVRTSEEIKEALLPLNRTITRFYTNIPSSTAYWNNNLYCSDPNPISDMIGNITSGVTAVVIADSIRNGASYVLYTDHGEPNGWQRPYFFGSNFPEDLNFKWPVYFNCCCYTGTFTGNCFAKQILTNPNGGIASISSSDIALEGFMSSLFEGIFDGIWPNQGLEPVFGVLANIGTPTHTQTPIYRLGNLLDYGLAFMKSQLKDAYATTNNPQHRVGDFIHMNEYMHAVFQLFGDPALEIRTLRPENVATPSICQFTDNTILVKTADGYSRIVLYDTSNDNVQTIYGTSALYTCATDGLMKFCVVRSNSCPYTSELSREQIDMFIQNENVNGINRFVGKDIMIGNTVTEDKPHGNVVFNSGCSTNLSGNNVKLKKGTKISLGSKICINNNL